MIHSLSWKWLRGWRSIWNSLCKVIVELAFNWNGLFLLKGQFWPWFLPNFLIGVINWTKLTKREKYRGKLMQLELGVKLIQEQIMGDYDCHIYLTTFLMISDMQLNFISFFLSFGESLCFYWRTWNNQFSLAIVFLFLAFYF